ncbi:MAG TPA: hypothetical protein VHC47_07300 [Mucilaginibacter sp.]|nr:hypothetical protein [Mucilaginibacter sp.]
MANKITIIFLIVFLLIKISPYYYAYQFAPRQVGAISRKVLKIAPNNNRRQVVISVDKAIYEKIASLSAPQIKFTGFPFSIFFLGIFFIPASLNNRLFRTFHHFFSKKEACTNLCVLRL